MLPEHDRNSCMRLTRWFRCFQWNVNGFFSKKKDGTMLDLREKAHWADERRQKKKLNGFPFYTSEKVFSLTCLTFCLTKILGKTIQKKACTHTKTTISIYNRIFFSHQITNSASNKIPILYPWQKWRLQKKLFCTNVYKFQCILMCALIRNVVHFRLFDLNKHAIN